VEMRCLLLSGILPLGNICASQIVLYVAPTMNLKNPAIRLVKNFRVGLSQ
jgi:hypothetical protein